MADAVGDVAQQEFFAPRHSDVADHEHIDRFLLGSADDRHRRIVIDDQQRAAAFPGEFLGIFGQALPWLRSLARCSAAPDFVAAGLCDTTICTRTNSAPQRSANEAAHRTACVRRFRSIGRHHHSPYREGQSAAFLSSVHGCVERVSHGNPLAGIRHGRRTAGFPPQLGTCIIYASPQSHSASENTSDPCQQRKFW